MKTRTKALLLTLCAVLLVTASVMGTMAYLTSTDEVKNTFTVGQVNITLDEAKVGDDGKALTGDSAERVKTNTYKLMPGHEYDKDPTVHIAAGSEESYVRLLVTATFDKALSPDQLKLDLSSVFTGYSANWKQVSKTVSEDNKTIVYEYRYGTGTVAATATARDLEPLFTGVKVPDTWTNTELAAIGGVKIDIVAQAIQADGFVATEEKSAADAAWEAFGD